MSVTTNSALFDLLTESDILSEEELKRAENLIGDQEDTRKAARALMKSDLLTRWQASQLLKGSKLLSLGKYVLLERLPWGSNHAVFLAKHPMMERKVALNVLDKASSNRTDSRESFLTDARAISSLDHRNLIHVFDIDEAQGRCFLVMEYVDGRNLHDVIKKDGPMSIDSAADITRQVAAGLSHAHKEKLIHGGLRPTNVILDGQHTAKVIDLGLSKFDDLSQRPSSGESESKILGIADYLSPEQASGGLPTAKSDIYSLGCIAFFLLSGEAPFARGSYTQRLQRHQHDSVPDVRKARKDTPEGLAEIIGKMMAKDPAKRYGSADEVTSALEKWWDEHAASRPKPAPKRPEAAKAAPAKSNGKPRTAPTASAPKAAAPPPKKTAPPNAAKPASETATGEAAATVADVPAIDVGGAKAKPAPAPAPVKPQASAAAGSSKPKPASSDAALQPAKKPAEKSGIPLPLILGAGGALLLLLAIGGGAGAYFFFFTGGEEPIEVAQATGVEAPAENVKGADGADASAGAEEPAVDGQPDDGQSLPQPGEGEEPADGAAPADGAEENGAADGGEPDADEGPDVEDPPAPVDPEPPVEEPPEKEDPKPEPPKDPKPAKPKNPFTALAGHVALPEIGGETQTASLAKINVPSDTACYIDLLCGDRVSPKEKDRFTLDRARNGLADREWEFKLETDEAEPKLIATMALVEQDLQFQWTEAGAKEEASPYLKNCLLNLRTADFEHFVALRAPTQANTLPFRLDGKLIRQKIEIEDAPRKENIFIKITGVEGVEKHEVAPKDQLTVDRDATAVRFGEGIEQRAAAQIESVMQKDLQLTVTPYVKAGNDWVKFNQRQLQGAAASLLANIQQGKQVIAATRQENKKKEYQAKLKTLEEQYSELEKLGTQLEKMSTSNIYIKYRVYCSDGVNEVTLVNGDIAPEAPAAPAVPK